MDKELNVITKDAELGTRLADKLMKVWRKNGEETWVLLHTEVQGQVQEHFPERMHIYNYRLFDRYYKPVVSLAILVDDNPNWRPHCYKRTLWGCRVEFDFIMIKLLDYAAAKEELTNSSNPFAVVILTQLAALQTKQDIQQRFASKLALTRNLYDRGFDKTAILNLYSFIDWVIALPEQLELQYLDEVEQFEEERQMAYITSAERIGFRRGEKAILLRQLQRKFGDIPSTYLNRIEQADSDTLLKWADIVIEANTLLEVFKENNNKKD